MKIEYPTFRRILPGDVPLLKQVEPLYNDTFNDVDRTEWSLMLKCLSHHSDDVEDMLYILDDEGDILGFIFLEMDTKYRLAYIIYLAVKESERSKGYGGMILRQVERMIRQRYPDQIDAIYAEIETIPASLTAEEYNALSTEQQNCYRRRQFYQRNGFAALNGLKVDLFPDSDYLMIAKRLNDSLPMDAAFWQRTITAMAEHWYELDANDENWARVKERFCALYGIQAEKAE